MSKDNFFIKKRINVSDVLYITRNGRKSVLQLANNRKIECFDTIKSIIEDDKTNSLECINKGIVVNKKHLDRIENSRYVMSDGSVFTGRVKTTKKELAMIEDEVINNKEHKWNQYSLFDNMPLAFCIIELVFDKNGEGLDFIFRYCNEEMANLEGRPVEEMVDNSFYKIFKNGDKKWLIIYADVALNGTKRIIESYSPEIDSQLRIYCFQPKPNFCACALVKL